MNLGSVWSTELLNSRTARATQILSQKTDKNTPCKDNIVLKTSQTRMLKQTSTVVRMRMFMARELTGLIFLSFPNLNNANIKSHYTIPKEN